MALWAILAVTGALLAGGGVYAFKKKPAPAGSDPMATTLRMLLQSLTISPLSVYSGSSITGTLTLNQPATAGGVTCTVSSDPAGTLTVPRTVTIPAGVTSANFTISSAAGVLVPTTITIYSNYNQTLHQAVTVLPAMVPMPTPVKPAALNSSFSGGALNSSLWVATNGVAPGSVAGVNDGSFSSANLDFSHGMMTMKMTQVASPKGGVISSGGEVRSVNTYGYGTYQFTMRMASTAATPTAPGTVVSGSDSGAFTFINNSQTEIDIEYLGNNPNNIWLTNWVNPTPANPPTLEQFDEPAIAGLADGFHQYNIIWTPGKVQWYIDGKLVTTHTKNVPSTPAYIMMNFWGTNQTSWGGLATTGVTRYFYVSNVQFFPM